MKQSRMSFLSIKLVMIENNSSSMHREYYKFYAVHVYLQSIRISLAWLNVVAIAHLFVQELVRPQVGDKEQVVWAFESRVKL